MIIVAFRKRFVEQEHTVSMYALHSFLTLHALLGATHILANLPLKSSFVVAPHDLNVV